LTEIVNTASAAGRSINKPWKSSREGYLYKVCNILKNIKLNAVKMKEVGEADGGWEMEGGAACDGAGSTPTVVAGTTLRIQRGGREGIQ
jgi:hypothetical protein